MISFCTKAIEAAKIAVNPPTIATACNAVAECSKSGYVRATRNTPAAAIVAAWMRALTGVGPSMASGSQTCRGNCADLPIAPAKIPIAAHVRTLPASIPLTAIPCNSAILNVPVREYNRMMAARKPKSPIRVTIKAFLAALAADGLWNQKPISK